MPIKDLFYKNSERPAFIVTLLFLLLLLIALPLAKAYPAHFISGNVSDARDTTSANDYTMTIYISGTPDNNLSDLIGPNGASGVNNLFLIDCQQLSPKCKVGDVITARVYDNGSHYNTGPVNVTVTGGQSDKILNTTLNSPPNATQTVVDDTLLSPVNEIDLLAGVNRTVFCNATLVDVDFFDSISSASAVLYDNSSSSPAASDDMSQHYTNNSCVLFAGSGNDRGVECSFAVAYYANNATWACNITATDNLTMSGSDNYDYSTINELVALNIPDNIDFGALSPGATSDVNKTNVTNFGNIEIDLKIYGYGNGQTTSPNALNCTGGEDKNISLYFLRYNVTDLPTCSNFGWTSNYRNLTNLSNEKTWPQFNLGKQNVEGTLMRNYTCWILKIPTASEATLGGTCKGIVSFIAIKS